MFSEYIRVTQIIGKFSGIDKIPDKYLIPAGERGTLVHNLIEKYIEGENNLDVPTEVAGYFESFLHYLDNSNIQDEELMIEKRFFCDENFVTGKIDCILSKKNENIIIDWKTGSKFSLGWSLQAGAYKMLCEANGLKISKALFVKLNKDASCAEIFEYNSKQLEEYKELFMKCLDVYRYFEAN